ncbi:hypothetical protein ACF0H5_015925 [Mactra antiquata]
MMKLTQTGGGRMLHMTPGELENENTKSVVLNSIAPAQQTVEQAKSELKREDINPISVVKTFHKSNSRSHRRTKYKPTYSRKSNKKLGKRVIKTKYPIEKWKLIKKQNKKPQKQNKKEKKSTGRKSRKIIKNKKNQLKRDIFGF